MAQWAGNPPFVEAIGAGSVESYSLLAWIETPSMRRRKFVQLACIAAAAAWPLVARASRSRCPKNRKAAACSGTICGPLRSPHGPTGGDGVGRSPGGYHLLHRWRGFRLLRARPAVRM